MKRIYMLMMVSVLVGIILLTPSLGLLAEGLVPTGPYLNANQKAVIGNWEIQVGNGIRWTKEVKGDKPEPVNNDDKDKPKEKGEKEPLKEVVKEQRKLASKKDMVFALIPVTIKNIGTTVASVPLNYDGYPLGWRLYDKNGAVYGINFEAWSTMPSSEAINLVDFLPGETRKGFIPFELPEGLDKNDKFIELLIPLVGVATWRL
ncbi:MAG TPA: hypothetical protein PKJ05_05100 [Bacillota bacterium]|nr:hypothetical protein [Bacillota bacterium]HOA15691.1 hypothetical protein [Bacillota bacterium]